MVDTTGVDYIPVNKAGDTMLGYLTLNGDPVSALQAVTKQYADAIAGGFTVKEACVCATTANLNATQAGAGVGATLTNAGAMAAFSSDGVSPSINDRVLVKNQTLSQHNGIYTLTTVGSGASNWVLTRATDYDDAAEIKPGTLVPVTMGALYAQSSWIQTDTVVTVDTDPISFSQFTASPNTFAVVALSNLSSVAINTSLLAASDGAIDLGSAAKRWRNTLTETIQTGTTNGNTTLFQAYNTGGASYTTFATLTAGATPTMSLSGSVTGVTQAANDNSTKLATTAYVDNSASGGANTHLSNLAAVAINTALLSNLDSSIDFGSAANRWNGMYGLTYRTGQSPGHQFLLEAYDVDGAAYTTFATLTANNTPTMSLSGAVTSITQSAGDNSTKLATTEYADRMVPLAGGTMSGLLVLSGDPVSALGACTKQYADAIAAGIDFKAACYAATTANLNATYLNGVSGVGATLTNAGALAAFSVDGVSPPINSRILVKNQSTTYQNGCYTLTTVGSGAVAWILTRSTDYDEVAEIFPGTLFPIENGTVNSVTSWIETATVAAIGTDPITFSQFTANPSSFANTALSNLAAVAINTSLLPGSDNTIDLGDGTHRFRELFASRVSPGSTSGNTLIFSARNTGGASDTTFITLTSDAATPTCALASAVTGVTQSASDNSTKLATTAYADAQVVAIAANKALSNLASVAINTDLLGSADNSRSLGSGTVRFKDTFTATLKTGTGAGNTVLFQAYDVDGAAYTTFATLTANNTPTFALASDVTGVTQSASDNSTKLATTAYADAQVSGIAANKALSNLASVAINTSLLPGSDNAIDIGSATLRVKDAFLSGKVKTGTTNTNTYSLSGYNTTGGTYTDFITVTTAATATCALASGVTGVTQTNGDNSTKLATTAYVDTRVPDPLTLTKGGTNANLTASNGGIFYSTSSAAAILSGTATALQMLQSGASGAPAWSTATYPATTTVNRILYSSSTNVVGQITTANSGLLVTDGSGVPSIGTAIPNGVTATTQAANDNSTKIATTAYADAISSGAGSIVYIAQAVASNSATVNFDNHLTSTYDNYLIVFDDMLPATTSTVLSGRVGTGGTPTYQATNYAGNASSIKNNGITAAASGATGADLNNSTVPMSNSSTYRTAGILRIFNANTASAPRSVNGQMSNFQTADSTYAQNVFSNIWTSTTVITSYQFLMSSGNISQGTFRLYGIKNS
jgi:hypothetical protein